MALPPAQTEAQLGPVLVEPLASGIGDRKASWLFRHPSNRTVVDQSVQRIGQSTIVQAGSRGRFQILERNTGLTVLPG